MNREFSTLLQQLRLSANLTNEQLAHLADVPESLLSGLQNGNRRVGEYQARKIGLALELEGEALEQFIYRAINTCTEKVLNASKDYPAELLNLLAVQLRQSGILAEAISDFTIKGNDQEQNIVLRLASGAKASLKTQLVCA